MITWHSGTIIFRRATHVQLVSLRPRKSFALDLPHVKYHVCINDCMIYRGEDEDKTTCSVCGVSRYKRGKKVIRKVVWYFPITPCLQRYFVDPEEAKLMTWHADRKNLKEDD